MLESTAASSVPVFDDTGTQRLFDLQKDNNGNLFLKGKFGRNYYQISTDRLLSMISQLNTGTTT